MQIIYTTLQSLRSGITYNTQKLVECDGWICEDHVHLVTTLLWWTTGEGKWCSYFSHIYFGVDKYLFYFLKIIMKIILKKLFCSYNFIYLSFLILLF